ncbi:MAG: carboxylating nicotinate-nucleotide diphosphorylase [Bacteroidales bacterium]
MKLPDEHFLLKRLLETALAEDIGDGDHTSLACIDASATGRMVLIVKQKGVFAGGRIAPLVFHAIDPNLRVKQLIADGAGIQPGDIALEVSGSQRSMLQAERLVLNILQRMSGIATETHRYTEKIKGFKARITDTRKTTPGMRLLEKEAVRIGGGMNHRMGLYDMILIKDNHIDFCGGIEKAIERAVQYLKTTGKNLMIEVEARTLSDVEKILRTGKVTRILLDNFSPAQTGEAVKLIAGRTETESSGGITLENVCDYAACGVDYISIGALTHQIRSLDMSLKMQH